MAIQYPVNVADTRNGWCLRRISTGVLTRNRSWPNAAGTPIVDLDPDYEYLRQVSQAVPDYDSRLQALVPQETVDSPGSQLLTTYTTPLLPGDQLKSAVRAKGDALLADVLALVGINNPVDMVDALGLLATSVKGITLPVDAQGRLDQFALLSSNYTNAVKARVEFLAGDGGWIDIHPGETPDIDAGWPDLPTAAGA